MKKSITFALLGTVAFLAFAGCTTNAVKFAQAMAKDPNTLSFSAKLITPWGQQDVAFARTGTTNTATASQGTASVNATK